MDSELQEQLEELGAQLADIAHVCRALKEGKCKEAILCSNCPYLAKGYIHQLTRIRKD